jgi:hypothetical protein
MQRCSVALAITLILTGDYETAKKSDNLNFDVRLSSIYLNTFSRYVAGVISDLKGKASADLHLSGTPEKPVVNGEVHLTKASCMVNYLGTRFSFTDDIIVDENQFVLKNFSLHDENGKEALINGEIRHNYFKKVLFRSFAARHGFHVSQYQFRAKHALLREGHCQRAKQHSKGTWRTCT